MLHAFAVCAAAYTLRRAPLVERVPGYACIPVPVDKIVGPGQRATMHIYDDSSLQAIRHAQAYGNGTYGQVVICEEAMAKRRFALRPVGSLIKVMSLTPATHTDKFGGSSASLMAEVMGIGIIEPEEVLEKMPFLTIKGNLEDGLLLPPATPAAGDCEALLEAAALCHRLDEIASFRGALTQAAERERGADAGASSPIECVDELLALRGCEPSDVGNASRAVLIALAASVHLPGSVRHEAMRLAQKEESARVLELVTSALEEEGRRRLAMKAIATLREE